MAILSPTEMIDWLAQNQFLTAVQLDMVRARLGAFPDTKALAKELIQLDLLTPFQANQICQGNHDHLVLGAYRLCERIGDGAMGEVFKAWSRRLQRMVAVKTIHKDRVNSPTAKQRFSREVQAAAQLAHPNIALVRDADEENNRPFLVMDYIEGINLSARVKQQGAVPIADAADYIRQAALGLQHAFERGVVHRDIKPANLMLVANKSGDARPLVKILDFGLARYESEQDNEARLTQLGKVLGTVDYVAPEQVQNASEADIRADIYALGCTFFYLLSAKPPFAGETVMEKITPRLTGEAPWVRTVAPDVPPGLEHVMRTMMARLPEDRYQTPIEVAQALAPFALLASAVPLPQPPVSTPVVLATPILAMPVNGPIDDVQAAPILAHPVDAPTPNTVRTPSRTAGPKLPIQGLVMAGGGLLLLAFLCLGGCFFWYPTAPGKRASILITKHTKLSTPNQTVQPGDTKRVLVYIERLHFEGPVTISLEQLPDGVVASPKTIPAKDDRAEIPFTVSHGTDPIATKIRVVAQCDAAAAFGELLLPFTIVAEKKKN